MSLRGRLKEELCRYVPPSRATEGPHGLFRYPAKYLPQIARAIVHELAPAGGTVLDPFSGSGTTLVEAGRLGRPSLGIDLNPLAVLLSKVKTRALAAGETTAAGESAVGRARALRHVPAPEFHNRDYWFAPSSLDPLSRLRASIDDEPVPALRDALLVAFLSIVKECSNASSYHYKLTRSREPDPVTGDEVYALFAKRVARTAAALGAVDLRADARCVRGDALRVPMPDRSVDAILTHPPYSISFDFVRVFKIYLWWLDPVRDTVALDRGMVGNQRRHVGELPTTGIAAIDDLARRIHERSARDGLAVAWFYADMDRAFVDWRRVLRPGGRMAMYMGDSQARGIMIDAPGNLARLAERAGFTLDFRLPRPVPRRASSSIRQIHVEELLVFTG